MQFLVRFTSYLKKKKVVEGKIYLGGLSLCCFSFFKTLQIDISQA